MKKIYITIIVAVLSLSCEYGRQAEEKLNKFNKKAEEFDAVVNEEIENLTDLDAVLPETSKKLKKADSIIRDTSATLDSINQTVNSVKNILN